MKYFIQTGVVLTAFMLLLSGCNNPAQNPEADLSSEADSASYTFGYLNGSQLANEGINEIDFENFLAGLQTGLNEEESIIARNEMQGLIQAFLQEAQLRRMERQTAEAEANEAEGSEFLATNADNDDVIETESGLQYRVIEEGDGERPAENDEVEVRYTGKLLSGEEFDSSGEETVTFPLNQVIPGWTEGVQLMTVGSTYEFFIPAELAYGSTPPPGSIIEPGAVLVFEVELVGIN